MDQIECTGENPRWLRIARAYESIGIAEVPGEEAHPLIQCFLRYTQLRGRKAAESDETPWCSAFVCACMEQAGIKSTGSAMARSWLDWGTAIDEPAYGCVVVLWRGRQASMQGHVGFCVGTSEGHVQLLGGNQHNSVCVAEYPLTRVLGYRLPS